MEKQAAVRLFLELQSMNHEKGRSACLPCCTRLDHYYHAEWFYSDDHGAKPRR